jgi:hypothetical protein
LQGNTPPGVAHGWLLHERPMHTLFAHRRPAEPAAQPSNTQTIRGIPCVATSTV